MSTYCSGMFQLDRYTGVLWHRVDQMSNRFSATLIFTTDCDVSKIELDPNIKFKH